MHLEQMRCLAIINPWIIVFLSSRRLDGSQAPEPDVEDASVDAQDECRYALGVLHRGLPVELRDKILGDLDLVEYHSYLQQDPILCQRYRLSEKKEMALLRWACGKIQELRHPCTFAEQSALELLQGAVRAIVKIMGVDIAEYQAASKQERPVLVAKGMEMAIFKITEISDMTFWVRLCIQPFLEFDDFPRVYRLLSKGFKQRYHHYMLRLSALAGNVEALVFFSPPQRRLDPKLLARLMTWGCSGGHIGVIEWVLSRRAVLKKELVEHGLVQAIVQGRLEVWKYLKKQYLEPPEDFYPRMVTLAITWGQLSALNHLVDNHLEHPFPSTPSAIRLGILSAAANGNVAMLKYFLEHSFKHQFEIKTAFKDALMLAVGKGHQDIVECLLSSRRKLLRAVNTEYPGFVNELFLLAARRGHLDLVRFFLKEGPRNFPLFPLFKPACQGNKAIILAAQHGHVKIIQYLLMLRGTGKQRYRGIDPSADNNAALMQAIDGRHHRVISLLRPYFDPEKDPHGVFYASCRNGNLGIIEFLRELRVFTRMTSDNLGTGVYDASHNGHRHIVEYIMETLMPPDARGISETLKYSLFSATSNGHVGIVHYLLQKDGHDQYRFHEINLRSYGYKLLNRAAESCRTQIIQFFLCTTPEGRRCFPEIETQALKWVPVESYVHHYPTARVVISALHGPCPYSAGSWLEKIWLVWHLYWQGYHSTLRPATWDELPEGVDCNWRRLARLAINVFFLVNVVTKCLLVGLFWLLLCLYQGS